MDGKQCNDPQRSCASLRGIPPERRHGKLENLLYGDLEMHAITGRDARCLSRPTRRTELCVNGSCG